MLVGIKSKNLTLPLSRWSLLILSSVSLGSALLLRPDFACTMLEAGAGMDLDEDSCADNLPFVTG